MLSTDNKEKEGKGCTYTTIILSFFAQLSGLGEGGREVLIALSAAAAEAVILRTPPIK